MGSEGGVGGGGVNVLRLISGRPSKRATVTEWRSPIWVFLCFVSVKGHLIQYFTLVPRNHALSEWATHTHLHRIAFQVLNILQTHLAFAVPYYRSACQNKLIGIFNRTSSYTRAVWLC